MIDPHALSPVGKRAHRVFDRIDGGLDAEVADRVTDHTPARAPCGEQQRRQLLARVEQKPAGARRAVAAHPHRAAIAAVHEDLQRARRRVVRPLEPAARANHQLAHVDRERSRRARLRVTPRHRRRHCCILDGGDAERRVALARRSRHLDEARLPRLAGERLDAAHRPLEEESRRLAGFVARDLAARRIGRAAGDAGLGERARVGHALVMREMHEQRGTIGHRRVEITARGMETDQTVVVADGTDPRADRRVDGSGGEGALQIGH